MDDSDFRKNATSIIYDVEVTATPLVNLKVVLAIALMTLLQKASFHHKDHKEKKAFSSANSLRSQRLRRFDRFLQ